MESEMKDKVREISAVISNLKYLQEIWFKSADTTKGVLQQAIELLKNSTPKDKILSEEEMESIMWNNTDKTGVTDLGVYAKAIFKAQQDKLANTKQDKQESEI